MKAYLNISSQSFSKVFFICTLILISNVYPQNTLWSENWEGNWTDNWHVDAGAWQVGEPTSGPNSAYTGDKCAGTILAGNYPANASTRLIRHTSFQVPSSNENPRLRFWQWFSIEGNDGGKVQIKVSGGDWETVSETYIHYGGGWTYTSIDLSAYSESTVQIGFLLTSEGIWGESSGWYIDDVSIQTGDISFNNPEDWENGLGDWHADRGTWQVGTPTNGPGSSHSGVNCAGTVLNANYPANASTRLISPLITIPSVDENPRLRFWQWFSIEGNDGGKVQIKVSGGDWETVSETYIHYGGGWTYTSIDLSAYSESTVQIGFLLTSEGIWGESSGWYIDDVSIQTGDISFNNPEDWENGLGDWHADRGTWQVGAPTNGPGSSHSGVNCAGTVLNANYPANASTKLISPLFLVDDESKNPSIGFWHWFSIEGNDNGYLTVQDEGGTWHRVLGPFSNSGNGWTYSYFDLTPYSNQRIKIGFELVSEGIWGESSGWYIDDIKFTGIILPQEPLMSVSPNSINFSEVYIGNTSKDTITVSNTGTDTLQVQSISISGDNPDKFSVDETIFSLIPEEHKDLVVSFTPDSESNFSAILSIISNGGNENIALSGECIRENHAPVITKAIPDTTFFEDSSSQNIVEDLNTIFTDPDGDALIFSTSSNNPNIQSSIKDDSLFVSSSNNYFGNDTILVIATDPGGLMAFDTFLVEITPVDDLPYAFHLISPENSIIINSEGDSTQFIWSLSEDVDNDTIYYDLKIWSANTEAIFTNISDTTKWIDSTIVFENGVEYNWTVFAHDGFTTISAVDTFTFNYILTDIGELTNSIPNEYSLNQNYPNPFNPTTQISFGLPKAGNVKIDVYNNLGQKVAALLDEHKTAGYHEVSFDANNLTSGVYFYRIEAGTFTKTEKMVLMR